MITKKVAKKEVHVAPKRVAPPVQMQQQSPYQMPMQQPQQMKKGGKLKKKK
jgi:hypothetical protein